MVINAWSATATAHFRKRRHGWIKWANEEHGMQIYRFKKQADLWLQEAETAIEALGAKAAVQVGKRLRNTPRKTPIPRYAAAQGRSGAD